MSGLSKKINLSKSYTNHSIRATLATLLSRNQFGGAQIISVTGHKYVSSLAVYQRVSDQEKLAMGHSVALHISSASSGTLPLPAPEMRLALPAPEIRPTLTVQDIRPALPNQESGPVLPGSEMSPVIDVTEEESQALQPYLQDILCDFSDIHDNSPSQSQTQTLSHTQILSSTSGMFNSCRIGNVTININVSK